MVSVDRDRCIGCGACAALAPNCFEMKDERARAKGSCKCDEKCKQAITNCPVGAIKA